MNKQGHIIMRTFDFFIDLRHIVCKQTFRRL